MTPTLHLTFFLQLVTILFLLGQTSTSLAQGTNVQDFLPSLKYDASSWKHVVIELPADRTMEEIKILKTSRSRSWSQLKSQHFHILPSTDGVVRISDPEVLPGEQYLYFAEFEERPAGQPSIRNPREFATTVTLPSIPEDLTVIPAEPVSEFEMRVCFSRTDDLRRLVWEDGVVARDEDFYARAGTYPVVSSPDENDPQRCFIEKGLEAGSSYHYQAYRYLDGLIEKFTTSPITLPRLAPTLRSSRQLADKIVLNWDDSDRFSTSHLIPPDSLDWAPVGSEDWTNLYQAEAGQEPLWQFEQTGLQPATTYLYRLGYTQENETRYKYEQFSTRELPDSLPIKDSKWEFSSHNGPNWIQLVAPRVTQFTERFASNDWSLSFNVEETQWSFEILQDDGTYSPAAIEVSIPLSSNGEQVHFIIENLIPDTRYTFRATASYGGYSVTSEPVTRYTSQSDPPFLLAGQTQVYSAISILPREEFLIRGALLWQRRGAEAGSQWADIVLSDPLTTDYDAGNERWDISVAPGQTYLYRARYDGSGTPNWSAPIELMSEAIPIERQLIKAHAVSSTRIHLFLPFSRNFGSLIRFETSPVGGTLPPVTLSDRISNHQSTDGNQIFFADTGLKPNTEYSYLVNDWQPPAGSVSAISSVEVVTPGTDDSPWRYRHQALGVQGMSLADLKETQDFDGVSYFEKYAFDLQLGQSTSASTINIPGAPSIKLNKEKGLMEAIFTRRKQPNLEYTVQVTSDLQSWINLETPCAVTDLGEELEIVCFEDNARPNTMATERLMRILVQEKADDAP